MFVKKREELVTSFLDKHVDIIGLTFKYETNQAAFDLVRDRFKSLWIDQHFLQILNDDISETTRKKIMSLLVNYLETNESTLNDSDIIHSLLQKKIEILGELISFEDNNIRKYNELKFSYERDKALFERELKKYESDKTIFRD
jgi:hypothetical protein